MSELKKIKRALISVSDKTNIIQIAQTLISHGVEIISTGGTYNILHQAGIPVVEVSHYTGATEMMGGRVKTLHPKVHGGILGRRGIDDEVMRKREINAIDMVIVNLYPFMQTMADPNSTFDHAIENIDIGGPAMLRSAAKNFNDVAIVTDATCYAAIQQELNNNNGCLSKQTRFQLSVKAFQHTANYDTAIADYLTAQLPTSTTPQETTDSATISLTFNHRQNLRYGENSHQQGAFYVDSDLDRQRFAIANAIQQQGKELSFNNIVDADAAMLTVHQFKHPACVIIKHANPCGVAEGQHATTPLLEVYEQAYRTDPESAFGGVIAFNRTLNLTTFKVLIERQFIEVLIAPAVEDGVLELAKTKANLRLLICGDDQAIHQQTDYKRVSGGLLIQDADTKLVSIDDCKVVSKITPSSQQLEDLLFAWKVAKMVKSNAIVYAKDRATVGVGAGQMSRVNSARIAAFKAEDVGLTVQGAVMASDAFFPFRDGIDQAVQVGINAIIQPGGSMRDQDIIQAVDEHGIAMLFTGMRHFRH